MKNINEKFNELLTGDTLKDALDFAEFIKENKFFWNGEFDIFYQNELLCYIDIPTEKKKRFQIWTVGDYSHELQEFPLSVVQKEIALEHVAKCTNCSDMNCGPGKNETIFGKKFPTVCHGVENLAMKFNNPTGQTLEVVKKLLLMRKYLIDNRAN